MEVEYIRELRDSYLQLTGEITDDYGMKMLLGRKIAGFLEVTERIVNGECRYMYRISSLISMEDCFISKNIMMSDMDALIHSFVNLIEMIEDNLMDYNGILLSPDMIFWDMKTGNWNFVYYPDKKEEFYDRLKALFEYIIKNVNHKDTGAVTMAYGIYKRLCEDNINPEELFEIETGEQEEGEIIQEEKIIETVIPEMVTEETEVRDDFKRYTLYGLIGSYGLIVIYVFLGIFIKGIRIGSISPIIYVGALIGLLVVGYYCYKNHYIDINHLTHIKEKEHELPYTKESVRIILPRENMAEDNLTVLLEEAPKENCHMIKWIEGCEEKNYRLSGVITVIGSAYDRADCIINQTGVSRVHARISCEGSKFYIKDMNSTNGTKVNKRLLACYELCELKTNDVIELGNLECIFV